MATHSRFSRNVTGALLGALGSAPLWFPQTSLYLDLKTAWVVATSYNPDMPSNYIARKGDEALKDAVHSLLGVNSKGSLFVTGEAGSGKTTQMQHILKREVKEGVICVRVDLDSTSDVRGAIESAVLEQFGEKCLMHKMAPDGFSDFMQRAAWVRQFFKWQKSHPLIVYVILESKAETEYDYWTLERIGRDGARSWAHDLSWLNIGNAIIEFPHTVMARYCSRVFHVQDMTESEFLAIGQQVLRTKDPQGLVLPYLQHHHDWLGGQTKTLAALADGARAKSMYSAVQSHNTLCRL